MTVIAQPEAGVSSWQIDPAHSNVEFAVKHMMISTVRGRFGDVSGTIQLDANHPTRSSASVTIDVASIDSRQAQRDTHLRSPDFFDVERFPTIGFRTRRVERTGETSYRVTGDLTIRDVTHEVELAVTEEGRNRDPWGVDRIAFSASTKIDRRDFGLTWNQALEAGGILVGDEIRISLEVEATRA
jgi:polyisoprenoid-binding protein YceI